MPGELLADVGSRLTARSRPRFPSHTNQSREAWFMLAGLLIRRSIRSDGGRRVLDCYIFASRCRLPCWCRSNVSLPSIRPPPVTEACPVDARPGRSQHCCRGVSTPELALVDVGVRVILRPGPRFRIDRIRLPIPASVLPVHTANLYHHDLRGVQESC